jgi:hypothetical protein
MTWHTGRQAWHSVGARNLLFIGGRDGLPHLPHDAQLAQLQMRKPLLTEKYCFYAVPCLFPEKLPISLFLPLLPYAATLTPVNRIM